MCVPLPPIAVESQENSMDEAHTPFTHHGLASRREDAIPGAAPQHSAAAAASRSSLPAILTCSSAYPKKNVLENAPEMPPEMAG
jgi:hypothetical protein